MLLNNILILDVILTGVWAGLWASLHYDAADAADDGYFIVSCHKASWNPKFQSK